jgi:hypothetical protein
VEEREVEVKEREEEVEVKMDVETLVRNESGSKRG